MGIEINLEISGNENEKGNYVMGVGAMGVVTALSLTFHATR